MLLPHHLYCLLRAIEVELVVLLSFLGVLLPSFALRSIVGSPVRTAPRIVNDALVQRLVMEAHLVSAAIGPGLHAWQKELIVHRRVKVREGAVFVLADALRVALDHPWVSQVVLHQDQVRVLVGALLCLSHLDAFVQEIDTFLVLFLQLGLEALVLYELEAIHLELVQGVALSSWRSEMTAATA